MTINVYCAKLLAFCIFLCASSVYGVDLIVNTSLGRVRGVAAEDGDYTMFLGIPFAKVNPDNPFGEALPHPAFEGIFEANDDSAICPQEEEFNHTIVGTLDCLHLNIHVPNSASPTNLRPVFVWIFGGGFTLGFYGRFLYGPKFLVRQDIVFVTINYRLGPYGFMCLDIPEVPGNTGLKDQLKALRWINENIANFGGDPDKITIAGNSAGSAAVDFHVMRKNDGQQLFHQAVFQSGTALTYISPESPKDAPVQMAQNLGFETIDLHEAIAFLAKVDPLEVIKTGLEINLLIGICVEKEFEGVEAFVTEDVATITEIPAIKDMPIMIGFTKDEILPVAQGGVGEFSQNVVYLIMALLFDPLHLDFGFMVEKTQQFYFGDEEINNGQIQEFVDFLGDALFIYPTHRTMKTFLDNDVGNMYLFQFSYDGERNFVKHRENITLEGAAHADELGYLFDISYMEEPNPDDQRVIDSMTAMWANFIKYADPTPQISDLLPHKWDAISKDSPYHYIDIDKELRIGTRPLQERMTYWDLFYEAYGYTKTFNLSSYTDIYKLMKKNLFTNKQILYYGCNPNRANNQDESHC